MRSVKKWLAAAASLMMVGAVMFAAVMTAYHWDFSRLSTDRFETNSYEIRDGFSGIELNTDTADILFAVSDDDTCKVVCYEEETMKHSVSVQNDTLTVLAADGRARFMHIGIHFHSPKITVYLPETEYTSIVIKAGTGDIEILNEITVDSVYISLSTGDIRVKNMSAETFDLSSSTGEMILSDVTCSGEMKASTATGDVNMTDVTCKDLISTGSTGDISLKNVIAAGTFSIERSTGSVLLDRSDASEILVETSMGDVTGSLLSEKIFLAETSTGRIRVPQSIAGGTCRVRTSTGDIYFM